MSERNREPSGLSDEASVDQWLLDAQGEEKNTQSGSSDGNAITADLPSPATQSNQHHSGNLSG